VLAPVLARLCEIPGVIDARVECSGTYFLVTGDDPAALERALPAIRAVLGQSARWVDGLDRERQLAARSRGELWFSSGDIRGLSYVEGRVLAARMLDGVAESIPLPPPQAEQVLEAVRAEIFAALEHAHDTGGRSSSGWFWEVWPSTVDRIHDRLREPVPEPEQRARIDRALRAQAPRGG
jgi:hypothetical protein